MGSWFYIMGSLFSRKEENSRICKPGSVYGSLSLWMQSKKKDAKKLTAHSDHISGALGSSDDNTTGV